jgi:hypothetical protein
MGNYHVPFWRAVEEVTPSLTLIIIRKVATTLGLCLRGVGSGALMTPLRVRLWTVHESPSWSGRSTRPRIEPLAVRQYSYGVPSIIS